MPYTIPRPKTLPFFHLKEGTQNKKLTGGDSLKKVAATVSGWQTCSKHCPMYNACYAKQGWHTRLHANKVTNSERGYNFDTFIENIESLRNKSFLRLSVSGDLPSEDWCYSTEERKIDLIKLKAIREAARSTKTTAYTYTHLHCDPKWKQFNLDAIKEVSTKDFCINISVETKKEALKLKSQGYDVALVDSKLFQEAKEGKVKGFFACPAQYKDENGEKGRCIDCKRCAMANRCDIVVFNKD